MIKIIEFDKIMQDDIKEFVINNINNELVVDNDTFVKIIYDLDDIYKNYIKRGGEFLYAYEAKHNKIIGTIALTYENNIPVLKRFYVAKEYRNKKIG